MLDEVIATRYIDELKALGHRPLWFSFSSPDWKQSAEVIAESLALAGEVGFEWFFGEYLDPRYPFVFAGGKLTDEVFEQWVAIRFGRLLPTQKVQLRSFRTPSPPADPGPARERLNKKVVAWGACALILAPALSAAFFTFYGGFLIMFAFTFLGTVMTSTSPGPRRPGPGPAPMSGRR